MSPLNMPGVEVAGQKKRAGSAACQTAFGRPRDFLDNRFVYVVVSPRARGLTVGLNLNPDKFCNFDCIYCEVDRAVAPRETRLDVGVMAAELERTLELIRSGRLQRMAPYRSLPAEFLELRDVVFSGDGEPTLSPYFGQVVESVAHLRARSGSGGFKVVLLTNGTGLDLPQVSAGLGLLTSDDEIWIKLDAGTPAFMRRVNRTTVPLEVVLDKIRVLGRRRPIVIQTLFPALEGKEPPPEEIEQYSRRLLELKTGGARISLVQIYSASRPMARSECGHLPLRSLFRIARTVRQMTGIRTEVF